MSKSIVNSGDIITIAAINWVAAPSSQTFLYAVSDKNWFGTDNNVRVANVGKNIDSKYQFKIIKCSPGSGPINYGDRVNLQSVNNNTYIQCGNGTCNSGNTSGCNTGDWQVFLITSPTRATGNLYIGDTFTFNQETGNHCSILPADNATVLCGSTNNNNQYLQILLKNGTNGISADESQTIYDNNRNALGNRQDPRQFNSFSQNTNITYIYIAFGILFLLLLSCIVIIALM